MSGFLVGSLLLALSGFLVDSLVFVLSRFLVDSLIFALSRLLVDSLLLALSGFLVDSLILVDSLVLALSGFRGRVFPCADHLRQGVQLISGARAAAGERRQQAAQKPRPIGRDQDPVDLDNKAEQVES